MENVFTRKDPLLDVINQVVLGEKKLTDAELKKREEIAQAIERENPGMDMGKKMAIATAQAKKVAEEVEQVDEAINVTKKVKHSLGFVSKGEPDHKDAPKWATHIGRTHEGAYHWLNKHSEVEAHDKNNYFPSADKTKFTGHVDKNKGKGFVKKLNHVSEEVNLEEQLENFWGAYLTCLDEAKDDASQQALLLRAMAKDPSDLMKMKRAIAMGDKALTNPVMRQEILKMLDQMMNLTVTDKALLQKTRSSFMKQKQFKAADTTNTEEYVPEEVEELDERNKENALRRKMMDASRGARWKIQNKMTADDVRDWDGKHKTNQAQNKAIGRALRNEEIEELDEISKKTLGSYIKKANADANDNAVRASWETSRIAVGDPNDPGSHNKANKYIRDLRNRKKGISRATDKLTKEEANDKPPFEGGREVKSSKPAAERVKKIAKGMQKKYTKKD